MSAADKERRFTVEAIDHDKRGNATRFGIRYTPPTKVHADGTRSMGLRFIVLEASEYLSDPEETLTQVASILEEHWA